MPAPIGTRNAEPSHKLGERAAQHNFTAPRPYRSVEIHARIRRGVGTVGELVFTRPTQDQLVRAVDALVLMTVAGVASRQGTQRHRSRHEAEIGGRFAGRDKPVYLIGKGEDPPVSVERLDVAGIADRSGRSGRIEAARPCLRCMADSPMRARHPDRASRQPPSRDPRMGFARPAGTLKREWGCRDSSIP